MYRDCIYRSSHVGLGSVSSAVASHRPARNWCCYLQTWSLTNRNCVCKASALTSQGIHSYYTSKQDPRWRYKPIGTFSNLSRQHLYGWQTTEHRSKSFFIRTDFGASPPPSEYRNGKSPASQPSDFRYSGSEVTEVNEVWVSDRRKPATVSDGLFPWTI
jgi:hypothetical protein